MPTTLDFAGVKAPAQIRGIKQDTIQGKSLFYSVANAKAPSTHKIQHYYIFGARAIYADGWKAGAAHCPDNVEIGNFTLGKPQPHGDFSKDTWELYNLKEDYTENNDLAAKCPQKLAELKALFEVQAKKYDLYPFVDWVDVAIKRKALAKKAAEEAAKKK